VLFRQDWVVYAKRPFGGPEHVLRYLGAYTHRVAISNSRLIALADGKVTFRWRDSAHGNKKRPMTLEIDEFLRRFLLHVLPPAFVRIRNFGFLANRRRATLLPLCFHLLGSSRQTADSPASTPTDNTHSLWNCPLCGGSMHVVERLSAAQLLLRSPPQQTEYSLEKAIAFAAPVSPPFPQGSSPRFPAGSSRLRHPKCNLRCTKTRHEVSINFLNSPVVGLTLRVIVCSAWHKAVVSD
jgi:hypothetical protein